MNFMVRELELITWFKKEINSTKTKVSLNWHSKPGVCQRLRVGGLHSPCQKGDMKGEEGGGGAGAAY